MIVVPDASSVLAAIFPDEGLDFGIFDLLSDSVVAAPSIWPAELANSMLMGVRRRRIALRDTEAAIALLGQLEMELVPRSLAEIGTTIIPLANKHRLTIYDALYLELARSRAATLVTIDKALARAAGLEGVKVV